MLSLTEAQELHELIGVAMIDADAGLATSNQLERARELAAVLVSDAEQDAPSDIVEAARELLDICANPRRYDQEDYDRAVSALRDATPPKPTTPIERWRWEDRGERGWWRINDELAIEDGPHSEPDPF